MRISDRHCAEKVSLAAVAAAFNGKESFLNSASLFGKHGKGAVTEESAEPVFNLEIEVSLLKTLLSVACISFRASSRSCNCSN
jgi:hypothetical protein